LVRQLLHECDHVVVLAEDDYSEDDLRVLRNLGADVQGCPPNNQDNLAQWYRWVWIDSFQTEHPDAQLLLVDDDLLINPSDFFAGLTSDASFVAAGGAPTNPVFVWCGVSCFRSSLLAGFSSSSFFRDDAGAGKTDEVALNRWLLSKNAQVSINPRFRRQPSGSDRRSLRHRPDHAAIRKAQFLSLLGSDFPNSRAVVDFIAKSEWPLAEQLKVGRHV
jgi:hypothetical protein